MHVDVCEKFQADLSLFQQCSPAQARHRNLVRWVQLIDFFARFTKTFEDSILAFKEPKHLNSNIKSFVDSKVCDQQRPLSPAKETDDTVRVVLPFKDQISADIVKEQLKDLSLKVNTTIQRVFACRKIEQELNVKEANPPIVNKQCVVYNFQCDLHAM